MEPVFENICVYTKENLIEIAKHSMQKMHKAYFIIFSVIFFISGLFLFLMKSRAIGILAFLGALLVLIRYIRYPRKMAKNAYLKTIETYGKEISINTKFYQDKIVMQGGGGIHPRKK